MVPVKQLAAAKSRLRGALPGVPHEELALALAADTLRAVLACPAVAEALVVTDDARVAAAARAAGARVLPDEPRAGLNAAFRHGAAGAAAGWVAGITGDVPALRPAELAGALLAAQNGHPAARRFLPDAPGGARCCSPPRLACRWILASGWGRQSRTRRAGRYRSTATGPACAGTWTPPRTWPPPPGSGWDRARPRSWPPLTPPALRAEPARPAPRAELTRAAPPAEPRVYGASMQGTVASYDAATRSGVLLLDDGTEMRFPARAFDASGLRLLRLGQRVRIDTDPDGEVVRVTLPTMI